MHCQQKTYDALSRLTFPHVVISGGEIAPVPHVPSVQVNDSFDFFNALALTGCWKGDDEPPRKINAKREMCFTEE